MKLFLLVKHKFIREIASRFTLIIQNGRGNDYSLFSCPLSCSRSNWELTHTADGCFVLEGDFCFKEHMVVIVVTELNGPDTIETRFAKNVTNAGTNAVSNRVWIVEVKVDWVLKQPDIANANIVRRAMRIELELCESDGSNKSKILRSRRRGRWMSLAFSFSFALRVKK